MVNRQQSWDSKPGSLASELCFNPACSNVRLTLGHVTFNQTVSGQGGGERVHISIMSAFTWEHTGTRVLGAMRAPLRF